MSAHTEVPVFAGCIWLIGGTSESASLAKGLTEAGLPFVVTVTTQSARELYAQTARVFVGALSASEMVEFAKKWQVRCILDASHPFAQVVSRQAIALTQNGATGSDDDSADGSDTDLNADSDTGKDTGKELAYLRYERPSVLALEQSVGSPVSQPTSQNAEDSVIYVDSLDNLIKTDILSHQRVLFTVGYRYLARFSALRQTSALFARVLPSVEAISGAIAAGFSSKEIVALRPPVSPAVEAALWQQWKITCVVAKASGVASGESTKRAIASKLGVQLILINRPQLIYPNQTNSVLSAVEFCSNVLSLYYPNA